MPPYYTFVNEKFSSQPKDHFLTPEEIDVIDSWAFIDPQNPQKPPAGDPADAPPAKVWPTRDWAIGKPDLVLTMEQPFVVPVAEKLEYQFARLRFNATEDRWVRAMEFRPGDTQVVHHIQAYFVPADNTAYVGTAAMGKIAGLDGEGGKYFHSYVPGDLDENALVLRPNEAVRIPKGMDILLELHYTPASEPRADRSSLALIFAPEPPETEICSYSFRTKRTLVKIPAHTEHKGASRTLWFRKDVLLHSVRAHMHEIGKSLRIDWIHRAADQTWPELFTAFPLFNFAWQRSVRYLPPVLVKAGQELQMTGYWDNSRFNPNNTDPDRDRIWGIQTDDEMLNLGVKYSIVDRKSGTSCQEAVP